MSTNEITAKAKTLSENGDCDGVIALLGDYVKENPDDKTALAFYFKNSALKIFFNKNISAEKLYGDVETRFEGIPEADALHLSDLSFSHAIATEYLSDNTDDEKLNLSFSWLEREIESLGEYLNNYDVFKKQMDGYCNTLTAFGFGGNTYYILSQFLDWKSVISENTLQYIVEKVRPVIDGTFISEEKIYNAYLKNAKGTVFPFDQKPQLRGGRADSVPSKEAKDFWQGYFNMVKEVREKELADFREMSSDNDHVLHAAYFAYTYIFNRLLENRGSLSEEEYEKVMAILKTIAVTEDNFTAKINDADRLYQCIYIPPMVQIKALVGKLLGKN